MSFCISPVQQFSNKSFTLVFLSEHFYSCSLGKISNVWLKFFFFFKSKNNSGPGFIHWLQSLWSIDFPCFSICEHFLIVLVYFALRGLGYELLTILRTPWRVVRMTFLLWEFHKANEQSYKAALRTKHGTALHYQAIANKVVNECVFIVLVYY